MWIISMKLNDEEISGNVFLFTVLLFFFFSFLFGLFNQ